jgi:hypothetical protein
MHVRNLRMTIASGSLTKSEAPSEIALLSLTSKTLLQKERLYIFLKLCCKMFLFTYTHAKAWCKS